MAGKFRVFAVFALALSIGVVSLVSTAAGAKKHGKKGGDSQPDDAH